MASLRGDEPQTPPSPPTRRMVQLSAIGEMAHAEWLKTFELRPGMNLYPGEFVVMPNHFHAIIGIGDNAYNTGGHNRRGRDAAANRFGPQSKNLASILRGFKSAVTVGARTMEPGFAWQERFHDHIIRNEDEYKRISNYIIHNPAKWKDDKFFTT